MRFRVWLAHPLLFTYRLRYWAWEKLNPDKPWLCPRTVQFCEQHFAGSQRGLEYGSGRSTQWFARLTRGLTSVEHSAAWHAEVVKQLEAAQVTNVDYLLVPLDHPREEGEHESYDPTPRYISVADRFADGELDFVIVDGHYRTNCIRRILPKIRRGGYLLVDDVNVWPSIDSIPVPRHWHIADDSSNGLKRCLIWQAS